MGLAHKYHKVIHNLLKEQGRERERTGKRMRDCWLVGYLFALILRFFLLLFFIVYSKHLCIFSFIHLFCYVIVVVSASLFHEAIFETMFGRICVRNETNCMYFHENPIYAIKCDWWNANFTIFFLSLSCSSIFLVTDVIYRSWKCGHG